MDIVGANYLNAVDQIRNQLKKNAIMVEYPIGAEDQFKGVIDLFEMKGYLF